VDGHFRLMSRDDTVAQINLRLTAELPRKPSDTFRCYQAHRQSPFLGSFESTPEVRALSSAGITRSKGTQPWTIPRATFNGGDPVTTRVDDVTALDFLVTMQEEEAKNDGHVTETLGWIAVERGSGVTGDGRAVDVGQTTAIALPEVTFLSFTQQQFPVMVGDIVSTKGPDPVFLRYQNLTAGDVELFLDEEQSLDAETAHVREDVSLFVAE